MATVIPEIGFDDDPTSPVSREETVTNRKPKATINMAPTMLPRRFELRREHDGQQQRDDAAEHEFHREIAIVREPRPA